MTATRSWIAIYPFTAAFFDAVGHSIRNEEAFLAQHGLEKQGFYRLKYLGWLLLLAFLSPRVREPSARVAFVSNVIQPAFMERDLVGFALCYLGKLNENPRDMRRHPSFVSPFSLGERLWLLLRGFGFYLRHRRYLRGYLHYVLEYGQIWCYLHRVGAVAVATTGLYTRYSTLLAFFAKAIGAESIFVQDGMIADLELPVKIPYDLLYVFDNYEKTRAGAYVWAPNGRYVIKGFRSGIRWEQLPRSDKVRIALAGQDLHVAQTLEALEAILPALDPARAELILYPHYREDPALYTLLEKRYPALRVEAGARHRNVDILITFYSTIVYDYLAVAPAIRIYCLATTPFRASYYDRPDILVFDDPRDLAEELVSQLGVQ